MQNLKVIEAGKKVSDFIEDLNTNFSAIENIIDNNENINKTITITSSDQSPSGGKNGDIWIVYEQQ